MDISILHPRARSHRTQAYAEETCAASIIMSKVASKLQHRVMLRRQGLLKPLTTTAATQTGDASVGTELGVYGDAPTHDVPGIYGASPRIMV